MLNHSEHEAARLKVVPLCLLIGGSLNNSHRAFRLLLHWTVNIGKRVQAQEAGEEEEAVVPGHSVKQLCQMRKQLSKLGHDCAKKKKRKSSLPQTFYKSLLPASLSLASAGAASPKQTLASKTATWSPELLLRRAERSDVMIVNFFTWAPDRSVCQCLLRPTTAEPPSRTAV